jgi:hypothetical protein
MFRICGRNGMDVDYGFGPEAGMDIDADGFMFPPLLEPSDDATTRFNGSSVISARKRVNFDVDTRLSHSSNGAF